MDMKGKVAIVTGGGTGIGRAVCLRLANAGAKAVVVNYSRSEADARATTDELGALGSEAVGHQADVSAAKGAKATIEDTTRRYGGLGALLHNARATPLGAPPPPGWP